MKGRTTCPKCKHEFLLDVPVDSKKPEVVCPNCNNKFTIQAKPPDPEPNDECSWEEHGEPRKTILSSIKPKSNRPMIAAILLICVFLIGITTAAYSETFIESTMDLANRVGMTGSVKILVTNQLNNSIENASIKIDGLTGTTDENGIYLAENIELGILNLELSANDFKTQKREILVIPFFDSESTIKMEEEDGKVSLIYFDTPGCTVILAIFSVFALFGTITCLKRQHLDVAIAGSLISIFSLGFFFIGSIISIIAFIFIMTSKEEFENG
ncbi:MAG: hypothetical protein KAH91_04120, partial [Thermoplasmatales archaeon]|nr:hypothetical protein [Thermoplasmatales archaeon]